MNREELEKLPGPARQEAARAWNAWVRMKQAERDVVLARQDYSTHLIRLRAVYHVPIRALARLLGKPKDHVARYSGAYQEPRYGGPPRADPAEKRGPWARPSRHIAGARPAPGSEPSVTRTEDNVRKVTET